MLGIGSVRTGSVLVSAGSDLACGRHNFIKGSDCMSGTDFTGINIVIAEILVGNIAVLKETEERGEDGERKRKLLLVAGKLLCNGQIVSVEDR